MIHACSRIYIFCWGIVKCHEAALTEDHVILRVEIEGLPAELGPLRHQLSFAPNLQIRIPL